MPGVDEFFQKSEQIHLREKHPLKKRFTYEGNKYPSAIKMAAKHRSVLVHHKCVLSKFFFLPYSDLLTCQYFVLLDQYIYKSTMPVMLKNIFMTHRGIRTHDLGNTA